MTRRDDYVAGLRSRLDRWNIAIAELEARVEKLDEGARVRCEQALAELQAKRKAARQTLEEIDAAAENIWSSLQEKADRTWLELSETLEKTRNEFKESRVLDEDPVGSESPTGTPGS